MRFLLAFALAVLISSLNYTSAQETDSLTKGLGRTIEIFRKGYVFENNKIGKAEVEITPDFLMGKLTVKKNIPEYASMAPDNFLPDLVANWKDLVKSVAEPNEVTAESKEQLMLIKYDPNFIYFVIGRRKESYLWHHTYFCLASFKVRRNVAIDDYFLLRYYEKEFGRDVKGIKQGDEVALIKAKLGQPSKVESTQAADL